MQPPPPLTFPQKPVIFGTPPDFFRHEICRASSGVRTSFVVVPGYDDCMEMEVPTGCPWDESLGDIASTNYDLISAQFRESVSVELPDCSASTVGDRTILRWNIK